MNALATRQSAWLVLVGSLLFQAACSPARATGPSAKPAPTAVVPVSAGNPDPEPFRARKPQPGSPGEFTYPTPKVVKLPSGLSVYLVQRPARVVAIEFNVRHGSASDPEGKSGAAALCARMLTEATRRKSALALSEAVEALGTNLQASASRDSSNVALSALPGDVEAALALLAEVITEPAFAPADFERVRAEWLDGLRAERQDPQRLAILLANRWLLGPRHGAPSGGRLGDVQKLTVGDLRAFHRQAYTPDNSALMLVGNFDENEVMKRVQALFGNLRGKDAIAPPPPVPESPLTQTQIRVLDRKDAVQSAIAVIQPFPRRSEAGFEARQILGRLLGGLFTSRLNTRLREEHAYTYGAAATPWAAKHSGALLVYTSVRTDVTAPALTDILGELDRTRDPKLGAPVGEEEMQRAKADLIFSLGASLEHPSRIADRIGASFIDGQAPEYDANYPALIRALPLPAVQMSGAALSTASRVVIVGDKVQITESLSKLGMPVESVPEGLLEN
ncbi:MAG TPA: pitrilysin family protein [Polyangiaceae bacterium]|nr:pitrilysin family protein [Polyangiaceae bacterium]